MDLREEFGLFDAVDPDLAAEKLIHPQFPRAAAYDPVWQARYGLGPNPLWFTESLSELLDLSPGNRVLDLGCGRAISSIFLAKEFGVEVVAVDVEVDPDQNRPLIAEAGVVSLVTPVRADAHALSFDVESFDAIVALDSYQYFGADVEFLPKLLRVLKPGGQLGAVVLGVTEELNGTMPEHLRQGSEPDLSEFHSAQWWSELWERSGLVDIEHADLMPDGWRHWLRWFELGSVTGPEPWRDYCTRWAHRMAVDGGRTLGFPRIVARKKASATADFSVHASVTTPHNTRSIRPPSRTTCWGHGSRQRSWTTAPRIRSSASRSAGRYRAPRSHRVGEDVRGPQRLALRASAH